MHRLALKRLIVAVLLAAKVGGAYGYAWTDEDGARRVRFGPDACYLEPVSRAAADGLAFAAPAPAALGDAFSLPLSLSQPAEGVPPVPRAAPVPGAAPPARERPRPPTEPGRVAFAHLETKK